MLKYHEKPWPHFTGSLPDDFYNHVKKAYLNNASIDELEALLGKGRAKKGMFLGDLIDGKSKKLGTSHADLNKVLSVFEKLNCKFQYF